MSKKAKARRLPGTEVQAKLRTLRTSARKLNLVAQSIRGLKVQRALNELEFSHKRIAKDVRKALYSAISKREQPQPRHRLAGRVGGLRGQEPGDEALFRPRAGPLVAYRKTVQ